MVKIVKVVNGFRDNEYDSFSEAIAASNQRKNLLKEKLSLINGQVLENYQFDGKKLVLCLKNDLFAIIFPDKNMINLDILVENPNLGKLWPSPEIYFELPSGTRFLWDWKKILDCFIGEEVIISPSDQVLFIFTKTSNEFLITFYKELLNSSNHYLSISEA